MTKERYQYIRAMLETFEDLPDGAFLACMEEQGIDADDLLEYAKEQERRKSRRKS